MFEAWNVAKGRKVQGGGEYFHKALYVAQQQAHVLEVFTVIILRLFYIIWCFNVITTIK